MKRIFVSIPHDLWNRIKKDFVGEMGESDSEVLRNMIIAYLSSQGYFMNPETERTEDALDAIQGVTRDQSILSEMITALTEILEEKGTIKASEWDNRVKKKIAEQAIRESDRQRRSKQR